MRTRDDIEAAKATYDAAITDADATSYPPGYISAITLTIDDKNVIVSPLTANIGGKTVTKTTDTNTADMNWRSDRIPSTTYYIYLGKYGVWYVDLTEPATLSGFYGQYHPTTGERYIGKFKLAADYSIYSVTVAGAVVGSGIEDGEVTADKVSTDFLQAVFAAITTLYVGYYGTGSYSSPDEGDQALLIEDAVIKLIKYLGGGWSDVNKMQMGKLSGALLLALFVGCGLVHPDAPITDLAEIIPTGNYHVIDCETAGFPDQNGDLPDGSTYAAQSSAWSKFGTYSFFADPASSAYLTFDDRIVINTNHALASWVKIDTVSSGKVFSSFSYYVDTNNRYLLSIQNVGTGFMLHFYEKVGGVEVQDIYITTSLPSAEGVHYVGVVVDFTAHEVALVVDGVALSETISDLTLSGVATTNQIAFLAENPASGTTIKQDDILFAWDDSCNADLLIQHYLSNLPWSTEYAYADLPIIPASGGYVNLKNSPTKYYAPTAGEESAGTLHMIPEADRPSSWVLNGGTATGFTDVDFSAYVPVGVKALLLKYAISWTGNGSADYSGWDLRTNGSSVTDPDQCVTILDYYTNLGSGTRKDIYGQITVGCDSTGIIEYRFFSGGTAVGALYLNIVGYYI